MLSPTPETLSTLCVGTAASVVGFLLQVGALPHRPQRPARGPAGVACVSALSSVPPAAPPRVHCGCNPPLCDRPSSADDLPSFAALSRRGGVAAVCPAVSNAPSLQGPRTYRESARATPSAAAERRRAETERAAASRGGAAASGRRRMPTGGPPAAACGRQRSKNSTGMDRGRGRGSRRS